MTTVSQLPTLLNLDLQSGDEFAFEVNFSLDLTGYTATSQIVSASYGEPVLTPTTTITNPAEGIITVSLTETQTAALRGTYRWSLTWVAPGGVTRQVLYGFVEVRG